MNAAEQANDISQVKSEIGGRFVRTKVFRRCFNCGHESYNPELVYVRGGTKNGYVTDGFIKCPRCQNKLHAWRGMRDRRC